MFELKDRDTFDIETRVRRGKSAVTTREYNADMRRLLPWPGRVDSKRPLTEFGAILVTIRPQENVDAHRHDDEECFIVTAGRADLEIEGQTTQLSSGDVAYIPRFWIHHLRNSNAEPFVFVDIYWSDKSRSFEAYRDAEFEDAL
ncbi:cupin domain-containing protein (plasmid) [Leisingera sp. S132]|uniref:cupin domain-containing protein n=1 Tax=Leisingera sp. S132 TaxID=2867016 RepID=UPI0021A81695|nr:cupin domain-containing protein [Leisingera sp. S132]UWQ81690.1 cupin domain-containing protein [Leisingera sp. S132]